MKKINDILTAVEVLETAGMEGVSVSSLAIDSREVEIGTMFVAIRGLQVDGHSYIGSAVEKGACAVVCEELPKEINPETAYIRVADSRSVQAILAANFYDHPSVKLKLVGVTGTNGKTTIATLLFNLTRKLGYKTGLLSTIENRIEDRVINATHTTPDPVKINQLLADMVEVGCEFCFMEVSSHAVKQDRIAGLHFSGAIFTNLTHDHLDYHVDFDDYLKAKKQFFDGLDSGSFALYNSDDRNGKIMVQNSKAAKYSYSLKSISDYKCKILEHHFDGMLLSIDNQEVWMKFIGRFNAYNILAIYAASKLLGFKTGEILKGISELGSVAGRFEYMRSSNGITAVVDYAHTPDALRNVLNTIQEIAEGSEQIITVVGAGGDRDKSKRSVMAKIAVEKSTKVILTSDNPRSENPDTIINDMYCGVEVGLRKKVLKITERREAIKTAIFLAQPGDIILVAGKGHETYQEVMGVRHHFDDKEEIIKFFNEQ